MQIRFYIHVVFKKVTIKKEPFAENSYRIQNIFFTTFV
jgi:hypothetical protein